MQSIYLHLAASDLAKLTLGQTASVTIKGKVKSLRDGIDPEEYRKRLDSKESGCCAMPYEQPAEVEIELESYKVNGLAKIEEALDESE